MANNCFYDIHVRGAAISVNQFWQTLSDKHPVHRFSRVFSADLYDLDTKVENGDEIVTASFCGDCAWSVAV